MGGETGTEIRAVLKGLLGGVGDAGWGGGAKWGVGGVRGTIYIYIYICLADLTFAQQKLKTCETYFVCPPHTPEINPAVVCSFNGFFNYTNLCFKFELAAQGGPFDLSVPHEVGLSAC